MSWRSFWRRRRADEPAGAFPTKSFRQYRETLEMGIDWMAFLEWSFEESHPPLHR